jgi:hypothetical protein
MSKSIPHASIIQNLQEAAKQARSELTGLLQNESRDFEALRISLTTYVENLQAVDALRASEGTTAPPPPKKESSAPAKGDITEIEDDATILSPPPDQAQDDDATVVDNSKRPGLELAIKPVKGRAYTMVLDGTKDKYYIGRKKYKTSDPDIDIPLSDRGVSSKHCEITWGKAEGGWMIKDLGATNGTILDGEKIEAPKQLPDQANVVIGETIIRFSFT